MKTTVLAVLAGALLLSAPASAETTQAGYAFCLSEEAYDQLTTAIINNDQHAQDFLYKMGACGPSLKGGLPATVLDRTWMGLVQARVYLDDNAFVVWGPMEAFK